jgi:hypothetical protein
VGAASNRHPCGFSGLERKGFDRVVAPGKMSRGGTKGKPLETDALAQPTPPSHVDRLPLPARSPSRRRVGYSWRHGGRGRARLTDGAARVRRGTQHHTSACAHRAFRLPIPVLPRPVGPLAPCFACRLSCCVALLSFPFREVWVVAGTAAPPPPSLGRGLEARMWEAVGQRICTAGYAAPCIF